MFDIWCIQKNNAMNTNKIFTILFSLSLLFVSTQSFAKNDDDPTKKEMYKQLRAFNGKLIRKALELEGTITGEHGVGLHKKEYLLEQHPDNIPVMKSIKRTIDPNNIMNPGALGL